MKQRKPFFQLMILFLLLTTIISCVDKVPLEEEQKVYAGKWVTNDGTWIHIYNDGTGSLEMANTSITGGAATISDSTIHIGLFGINSNFTIDQTPYQEDGKWKMRLSGNVYVKE